ncbi:MAG: hypothetical protein RI957_69 [Verrucomicrobiota bacterium]
MKNDASCDRLLALADCLLVALVIDVDEGDIRDEKWLVAWGAGVAHLHGVGHAGATAVMEGGFDRENGAFAYAVAKTNLAQGDGDKAALREIQAGGDPRGLVDPGEQPTAEKVTVLVEIGREDEALRLHGIGWEKMGPLSVHRAASAEHALFHDGKACIKGIGARSREKQGCGSREIE